MNCEHDWRFLERRWINDYLFYCTKCLVIKSKTINLKRMKGGMIE